MVRSFFRIPTENSGRCLLCLSFFHHLSVPASHATHLCLIWIQTVTEMPNLGEPEKVLDIMVLVTQGFKLSFSLKGQLVTNNRKISDARPLILVTSFMHYISCMTRKTKAKKFLIMLLSKNGTSWSVFIIISLVIRNADSWGRNHSLVFITSEIRVLYCSLQIFALNFWLQW